MKNLVLLLFLFPVNIFATVTYTGVNLTTAQYLSATTPASGSDITACYGGSILLRLEEIPTNPSGDKTLVEFVGFFRLYVASGTNNLTLDPARTGEPNITLATGGRTSGFILAGINNSSYTGTTASYWHIYFWDNQAGNKLTATQAVVDRSLYDLSSKAQSFGARTDGSEGSGIFIDNIEWIRLPMPTMFQHPLAIKNPAIYYYARWDLTDVYTGQAVNGVTVLLQYTLTANGSPSFSTFTNSLPVADPTATASSQSLGKAFLDGSKSYDIDQTAFGDRGLAATTFAWALVTKPGGAATPTIVCATCDVTYITGVDTIGSYTYSLTVTDDASASSSTVNVTFNVHNILAAISASSTTVYVGDSIVFTGSGSQGVGLGKLTGSAALDSAYGYSWDFGDNLGTYSKAIVQNPPHVYRYAGNYTVTLTTTNWNGQVDTETVGITVNNWPTSFVSTIDVTNGGDIQAAINTAAANSTGNVRIRLVEGGLYNLSTTLELKLKAGAATDGIFFETAGLTNGSWPAWGRRAGSTHASMMAKIQQTTANLPIMKTTEGVAVKNYFFRGIDFYSSQTFADYGMFIIGISTGDELQDTLAEIPHHFIFAQCYVHGDPSNSKMIIRAFNFSANFVTFMDGTIDEIKSSAQTQGITNLNGNGPMAVLNNRIYSTGENIFTGGALPVIPDISPQVLVWGNDVGKYAKWDSRDGSYIGNPTGGGIWDIENLTEFKNFHDSIIDGNIFDRCWVQGSQAGYAININNVIDGAQGRRQEWLQVTNNKFQNTGRWLLLRGRELTIGPVGRWWFFDNNLAYHIGPILDDPSTSGWGIFQATVIGLSFNHVTVDQTANAWVMATISDDATPRGLNGNPIVLNSVFRHNLYGIFGPGGTVGTTTFNTHARGWDFRDVTMIGIDAGGLDGSYYPASDGSNIYSILDANYSAQFVNYAGGNLAIAPTSLAYQAGTDGLSHGYKKDVLDSATAGVYTGIWDSNIMKCNWHLTACAAQ